MSKSTVSGFLPEPVLRYFRFAIPSTGRMIRRARLKQKGTFLAPGSSRWQPFEAEEAFATRPRSLMWDARIRMAPFLTARVRDEYRMGRGSIRVSVLGFIKLANEHDHPEFDAGVLQRYLAEAIWFPTALLPDEGVVWTGIDESRALATLTDAGTTVSLEFTFAPGGEITHIFTPGRYRAENGRFGLAPWGASCNRYEDHGGIRIPSYCEVFWKLDGRTCPYWRGEVAGVTYKFEA